MLSTWMGVREGGWCLDSLGPSRGSCVGVPISTDWGYTCGPEERYIPNTFASDAHCILLFASPFVCIGFSFFSIPPKFFGRWVGHKSLTVLA